MLNYLSLSTKYTRTAIPLKKYCNLVVHIHKPKYIRYSMNQMNQSIGLIEINVVRCVGSVQIWCTADTDSSKV